MLVFIPSGIPGMGKSYLRKKLAESATKIENCYFDYISSDEVAG